MVKKPNRYDDLISKAYEEIGKKLTTKDRKKLRPSQFCAPNEGFPVE